MTNPDFDHPYSDAVAVGDLVFVSGCLPVDEDENLIKGPDALDAALGMVERRLGSVGLGLPDVVKLTYFVTDIADRPAANDQYVRTWEEPRPARTMIGVAALPRGASVEIDAIARLTR
ncbi:enamine deaminase RidA [Mycolicibacterium chitae]|uniref:Endoribonuclease L-PSP n=1 Tax=Mycolicibacterium chitae TaxID=1792 RepID=A0A3S4VE16_MYCCI|nr:RidA family protein [Mycolicibacterium chitae]MCV7107108.1 RidA family protein [Mycolicibacterium chitae]BBZ02626.1 enamine deaminase RidA [Mycolicibacterium chitae]VEG45366.1 endoribonuclease L-PSP [Mycolicibacterium chitae]